MSKSLIFFLISAFILIWALSDYIIIGNDYFSCSSTRINQRIEDVKKIAQVISSYKKEHNGKYPESLGKLKDRNDYSIVDKYSKTNAIKYYYQEGANLVYKDVLFEVFYPEASVTYHVDGSINYQRQFEHVRQARK